MVNLHARVCACVRPCVRVYVCVQHPTALCPPEYMVCFLHRLIAAVRSCWDDACRKNPGSISTDGNTSLSSVLPRQPHP